MNFSTRQFLFRYSLAKPGTMRAFKRAIKIQQQSPEIINHIAWEKLKKLLVEVEQNVTWYEQQFKKSGITPDDIRSEKDFQKLPVLNRNDLIQHFDKFVSGKISINALKISTTGGSTGTPLKIGMDPVLIREVPKWQMLSWWNLSPTVNMASIYRGLPVYGIRKMVLNLINWPQKVVRMDATNMNQSNIRNFISEFKIHKPQLIHGYVGAVDTIADYLLANNIKLPAPKVIWTTAAPLTNIQANKIEKAFGAPVCDQYGCSELFFIAAECPHKKGLHIFADSVKVEILDDNDQSLPDGEFGRIVITNLNETMFPLIRYANGDIGRLLKHQCSCGINLPLLDKVKGRISDNIILPDGTVLSGEYLTTIFDDHTSKVKQFQIVQKKTGDIIVRVVFYTNSINNESIIDKVLNELQQRIKQQVPLFFEKVQTIPSEKGKLQFIIKEY